DSTLLAHHRVDDRLGLRGIERVRDAAVGAPAAVTDRGRRLVEPSRVDVDADDDAPFAADDLRRGLADAAGSRGDERDLVLEAHASSSYALFFSRSATG